MKYWFCMVTFKKYWFRIVTFTNYHKSWTSQQLFLLFHVTAYDMRRSTRPSVCSLKAIGIPRLSKPVSMSTKLWNFFSISLTTISPLKLWNLFQYRRTQSPETSCSNPSSYKDLTICVLLKLCSSFLVKNLIFQDA